MFSSEDEGERQAANELSRLAQAAGICGAVSSLLFICNRRAGHKEAQRDSVHQAVDVNGMVTDTWV